MVKSPAEKSEILLGWSIRCYNIATYPLYFVRSGRIYPNKDDYLGVPGIDGVLLSSSAASQDSSNAFALSVYYLFFSVFVDTSRGPWQRWVAYPLCCRKSFISLFF